MDQGSTQRSTGALALVLVLMAPAAQAAISLVQVTANGCWTGNGCPMWLLPDAGPPGLMAPFNYPAVPGNAIVLGINWSPANAPPPTLWDSAGNTYRVAVGPTVGLSTFDSTSMLVVAAGIDGGVILQPTLQSDQVTNFEIIAAEYAGVDPLNPLDGTSAGENSNGANGPDTMSAPFTTQTPGSLLVAFVFTGYGVGDAGPGFAWRKLYGGTQADGMEDALAPTPATYQASAPDVVPGTISVAALRPAGSVARRGDPLDVGFGCSAASSSTPTGWIALCLVALGMRLARRKGAGLALLLGLISLPATAAISLVQTTANSCWTGNGCPLYLLPDAGPPGVTAPFNFPAAAGNTVVLGINWSPAAAPPPTLGDNAGNVYHVAVGPTVGLDGYDNTSMLVYAAGIDGGVILQPTLQSDTLTNFEIIGAEYAGVYTPDPVDATASGENANGVNGPDTVSAPFTTSSPDSQMVAFVFTGYGVNDAGPGFVWRKLYGGAQPDGMEDAVAATPGTYQASAPNVVPGTITVIALRSAAPSGGDGGNPPPNQPHGCQSASGPTILLLAWLAACFFALRRKRVRGA